MKSLIRRPLALLASLAVVVSGLIVGAPQASAASAAQTGSVPTLYINMTGTCYRTDPYLSPIAPCTSPGQAYSAVNGSGSHTVAGGATYEVVDPANPSNNFTDTGTTQADGSTAYGEIRGRGNYTWQTLPNLDQLGSWTAPAVFSSNQVSKRPYQMKLSSKHDMLGMGSAKTWILLANHADASLMRNKTALDLAAEFGMPYTPQSRFIDLVINGTYLGNYLLTEKVQEGSTRVALKNTNGVLVELDNNYWATEPPSLHFYAGRSKSHFILKDAYDGAIPDPDAKGNVTLPQNILDGWNNFKTQLDIFEYQLYSGSPDWSQIESTIDVDSFLRFYFIQEFTENPEVARSSIYFYKDGFTDKIHAGPVWDFDSSLGNYSDPGLGGNPNVLYTRYIKNYRPDTPEKASNDYYQRLFKLGQFASAAQKLYTNELKLPVEESVVKLSKYQDLAVASASKSFSKWPILGRNRLLPPFTSTFRSTWAGEIQDLRSYMQARVRLLNSTYAPGVGSNASDCAASTATAAITTPGAFNALSPCRMLDTRTGNGAQGPIASDGQVALKVTGRGGVPTTASAVVLNVTVTNSTHSGHITAYPSGSAVPDVSNLNFTPGQVVANQVTVKVGADGVVNLKNSPGGTTHLVADVAGFFVKGTASAAGSFTALDPQRILDTRVGIGATKAKVPGGGSVELQVTGAGGVPADAGAVALNVTVTNTASDGHITVYPTGGAAPSSSNVNFKAGQTAPNAVTVKLGSGGKVTLFNAGKGALDLIADVNGAYKVGTATEPGMFVPLTPSRIFDTRDGTGMPKGDFKAGTKRMLNNFETVGFKVAGAGGVHTTNAGAVVMNVTVANPTQPGYVSTFPAGVVRPATSSVNFSQWQDIPNLVTVKLGTGGVVNVYAMNAGQTNVIADVAGYYVK